MNHSLKSSNTSLLVIYTVIIIVLVSVSGSCESPDSFTPKLVQDSMAVSTRYIVEVEDYIHASTSADIINIDAVDSYVHLSENGWIEFIADIPESGKYNILINASPNKPIETKIWLEDYLDSPEGQSHLLTGKITFHDSTNKFSIAKVEGTPLRSGNHLMKLHFDQSIDIDWVEFQLTQKRIHTPLHLTQNTSGTQWSLVWSDEFELNFIDSSKWSFEVGDWGWGENGVQYYTNGDRKNARIEDGKMVIEAWKEHKRKSWTSARLSTQGRVSFLYGKIEIRAKVPVEDMAWASVWTRGDNYVDEGNKTQCGEISILNSHGSEIIDETGNGVVHASRHFGSDYFNTKGENSGSIFVKNLNNEFHTYSIEWMPNKIMEFVDDRLYAVYDQGSTDLSWPYNNPQNIIMELAIGGYPGSVTDFGLNNMSSKMIIDYVRVYELR